MKTIYKFTLEVAARQYIMMPMGRRILSVQMQHGKPCIWAEVDSDISMQQNVILMRGTGQALGDAERSKYIGTIQDGGLVWHVYSLGDPDA